MRKKPVTVVETTAPTPPVSGPLITPKASNASKAPNGAAAAVPIPKFTP